MKKETMNKLYDATAKSIIEAGDYKNNPIIDDMSKNINGLLSILTYIDPENANPFCTALSEFYSDHDDKDNMNKAIIDKMSSSIGHIANLTKNLSVAFSDVIIRDKFTDTETTAELLESILVHNYSFVHVVSAYYEHMYKENKDSKYMDLWVHFNEEALKHCMPYNEFKAYIGYDSLTDLAKCLYDNMAVEYNESNIQYLDPTTARYKFIETALVKHTCNDFTMHRLITLVPDRKFHTAESQRMMLKFTAPSIESIDLIIDTDRQLIIDAFKHAYSKVTSAHDNLQIYYPLEVACKVMDINDLISIIPSKFVNDSISLCDFIKAGGKKEKITTAMAKLDSANYVDFDKDLQDIIHEVFTIKTSKDDDELFTLTNKFSGEITTIQSMRIQKLSFIKYANVDKLAVDDLAELAWGYNAIDTFDISNRSDDDKDKYVDALVNIAGRDPEAMTKICKLYNKLESSEASE